MFWMRAYPLQGQVGGGWAFLTLMMRIYLEINFLFFYRMDAAASWIPIAQISTVAFSPSP